VRENEKKGSFLMTRTCAAAVVLAAGQSRRMGRPKMILPWGQTTVIGQVVSVLFEAGVSQVVVVTGGAGAQVAEALQGQPVRLAENPAYADGEMLSSVQVGLAALPADCPAALIVLGDQPQIEAGVVKALLARYCAGASALIVPSYQMRRGHPWLIERCLWAELLEPGASTMRDFLNAHAAEIDYLSVQTASVLQDLDTPHDYDRFKPKKS